MAEAVAVKAEEATNGPDEPSVGATTEPDDGGGGGGAGGEGAVSIPAGLEHLSEDGTITFTKVNANTYASPPIEAKDDWDEAELERLVGAYGAQIKKVVLKFDYNNKEVLTEASVEAVAKHCPNLEELVVE